MRSSWDVSVPLSFNVLDIGAVIAFLAIFAVVAMILKSSKRNSPR